MKQLLLISACLLFSFMGMGQDIHFSQFDQASQQINPATTGVFRGYQRLILNYRSQWTSVGSPYTTMGGSFDMPVFFGSKLPRKVQERRGKERGYLGLGVHFFKDIAGDANYGITNMGASIAGCLPVAENNRIGAGIMLGAGQRSGNFENLYFQSQFNGEIFDPNIDPGEGNMLNSSMYFDVAAGGFWQYRNVNRKFRTKQVTMASIGGAYYHANKPTLQFITTADETLHSKWIAHASMRFDFKESGAGIVPSFFMAKQGTHQEMTGGVMLRVLMKEEARYTSILNESAFLFGVHYRHEDAVIPRILLELSDFRLGFSYDYNISDLAEVSGGLGAFEISFSWVNVRKGLLRSGSGGGRARL